MLELMTEGYLETFATRALHLSTLIQQCMSLIVQKGGTSIGRLHRILVEDGAFREVSRDTFLELLRAMKEQDLIVQMPDGLLLLGSKGERISEHYTFYAAFTTPEEYRIVADPRTLGTLPIEFPVAAGDPIIFAGKRWEVVEVDDLRRTILVKKAFGKRAPRFGGESSLLGHEVRQRMKALYLRQDIPPFLDPGAKKMLEEGRSAFARHGLEHKPLYELGRDTLVFPWSGDKETSTLRLMLAARGVPCDQESGVLLAAASMAGVMAALEKLVAGPPVDEVALASQVMNKRREKHDWALTDHLLNATFASARLDVPGAMALAREIIGAGKGLEWS
jgi:ATP-dependent Lhr-like helicase